MNTIYQNGMEIIQTSEYIKVNGELIPLPDEVKKTNSNYCNITDGQIEINGFIFNPRTRKFKRKPFFKRLFGL